MTQEAFTGDLTGDITNDPLFERKLEAVVEGLAPYFRKCILNFFPENAKLVVDFINSELQYNNIRVLTKKNKIQAVDEFTKFLRKKYGHEIPLKQVGREDFEDFQSSKRKTESIDPLHRWIGTYNQFIRNLKPFYKYVYHSNVPPKERKLPDFLKGINSLRRKEKTCYTASDMWTSEDDDLFGKYCENPTIRLYHVILSANIAGEF